MVIITMQYDDIVIISLYVYENIVSLYMLDLLMLPYIINTSSDTLSYT